MDENNFKKIQDPPKRKEAPSKVELLRGVLGYDNRLEMIRKVLKVYSGFLDASGRDPIYERHQNMMSCYIVYGYSLDSTKKFQEIFGVSNSYLRVLNTEVRRIGYLVKDNESDRDYRLSDEMEYLRRYFITSNNDGEPLGFNIVFFRRGLRSYDNPAEFNNDENQEE